MFVLEEVTEHDLPEFMLERLRENPDLMEKVCRETDWDKPWILGIDVVTTTPTETPVSEEVSSSGDEDEETTLIEEAEEPEKPTEEKKQEESKTKEPNQRDIESLLEQMLAMLTPTPAPVFGQYVYTSSNDEITDSNNDVIGTWNNGNPRFSKAGTYQIPLDVPGAGTANFADIDMQNSVSGITLDAPSLNLTAYDIMNTFKSNQNLNTQNFTIVGQNMSITQSYNPGSSTSSYTGTVKNSLYFWYIEKLRS